MIAHSLFDSLNAVINIGAWVLLALVGLLVAFVIFLVWRDGYIRGWRTARAHPPRCPDCGYNLSGLKQCRCPECGKEYTLEELFQSAILTTPKQNRGE